MTKRKREEEPQQQQQQHQQQQQQQQDTSNEVVANNEESSTAAEEAASDNVSASNTLRRKSNRISLKRSLFVEQTSAKSKADEHTPSTSDNASDGANSLKHSVKDAHESTTTAATHNSAPPAKTFRKAQVWTEEDTRWFFEALCEHGKEFPAIQAYMAARCEKKGIAADLVKTYEQVRHYYYRMWHKISPMLNISNDLEKNVQELYGLINYGEVWKKFGTKLDSKLRDSFQHLVFSGHTVFKVKGKTVRVRTPVCNALKRLHKMDVGQKSSQLVAHPVPKEVLVEIIPATNSDWWTVQNIAKNPRLRTCLSTQARLLTLVEYLERRWSQARIRQTEMKELFGESLDSTKVFANHRHLLLRPADSMKLCEKMLLKNASGSNTSGGQQVLVSDISLNAYLKNVFDNADNAKLKKLKKGSKKGGKGCENKPDVTPAVETNAADEEKETAEEQPTTDQQPNNQVDDILKMIDSMNEKLEPTVINPKPNNNHYYDDAEMDRNDLNDKNVSSTTCKDRQSTTTTTTTTTTHVSSLCEFKLPEPPSNATLGQWLAGETVTPCEEEKTENAENPKNKNKGKKRRASSSGSEELIPLLTAEKARAGWTAADANSVSIGELYLLCGHPEKIVLEYHWVSEDSSSSSSSSEQNQAKENSATFLQKFFLAANLCLNNITKKTSHSISTAAAAAAAAVTAPTAKASTKAKRNVKNATQSNNSSTTKNSKLLSDLIQETILSESTGGTDNSSPSTTSNTKSSSMPAKTTIAIKSLPIAQMKTDVRGLNNLKTDNQVHFITGLSGLSHQPPKPPPLPPPLLPTQLNNINGSQKVFLQILTSEGKKNIELIQSVPLSIAPCNGAPVSGPSMVLPAQLNAKELFLNSNANNNNGPSTSMGMSLMPITSKPIQSQSDQEDKDSADRNDLTSMQPVPSSTISNLEHLMRDEDSFDLAAFANGDWLNDVQNISISSLIGMPSTTSHGEAQSNMVEDIQISELNFAKFAEQINQASNEMS